MFRPIAAIIRFSFESMVVVFIGLVWLHHDGEISTAVMFAIVKGHQPTSS
jgi:exosome complex RNA-binding protein Rrp42 (RNase PH superfamily)